MSSVLHGLGKALALDGDASRSLHRAGLHASDAAKICHFVYIKRCNPMAIVAL